MTLSNEKQLVEFLNNIEDDPNILPCPIDLKGPISEHEFFRNINAYFKTACCVQHFGVDMWISGFLAGQAYCNRKAELDELEKCYGTDTGTD